MKTKIILGTLCLLFISLYSSAQVDISILNKGIKEHVQEKIKNNKDSLNLIQNQIDALKKQRDEDEFLRQLNLQYEGDRNTTLRAIEAKKNELKIASQNQELAKVNVSSKYGELVGLFTEKDPIPVKLDSVINESINSLSRIPTVDEKKIDKLVVVNERYSKEQKDSLTALTLEYRKFDFILSKTNEKIKEGKESIETINNDIKNRKAFLLNAALMQKEYELEMGNKSKLMNSEDSITTSQRKILDIETQKYKDFKVKIIAIKDQKLEPEEKIVFDKIEYELEKVSEDSTVITTDSISSKFFKEQYNQLVKMNMELAKKKKDNVELGKKIVFIKGINLNLENSIQSVYVQEKQSLETAIKEKEILEKKLNDAKNGIFDDTGQQQVKSDNTEKDLKTDEKNPPKRKRRW